MRTTRLPLVCRTVLSAAVTAFAITRISAVAYSPLLGIEDAISPLRMGIMINAEHPFRVLITTAIILDPSVAGNENGMTYNAENKTWSVVFSYGTVSGIATCNSTSGTYATAYPEYNFDNDHASSEGVFCWCRMTSPVRSAWVFTIPDHFGTSGECKLGCAGYCGYYFDGAPTFRGGVFGSAGN